MYKTKILIGYCTMLICMMAFYNKFPLLTGDSGFYIDAGFSRKYLLTIYGFFIAHSSWGKSLWPVVICQSGLLSILFYYWFKYFSPPTTANLIYMCCVFIVSFCMSGSVVSSTISPGVFKGIGILSTGLILLAKNLNKRDYGIVAVILLLSGLVDLGNTLCIISLSITWAILKLRNRTKLALPRNGPLGIRIFVLPGVCVLLLTFFYQQGQTYWLNADEWRATKIHFFTKADLLPKYLVTKAKENKTQTEYNSLDSRLTKETQIKEAYSADELKHFEYVIFEMRSRPDYPRRFTKALLGNFLKQSLNLPIDLYPIQYHGSKSFQAVYHWFNWESREYLITRQLQNWLDVRYLGYMQLLLVIFVSLTGLVMLVSKFKSKVGPVFLFCYLAYFMQAFFTSLLEGAVVKLDNQVAWLLVLPYLIHLSSTGLMQSASRRLTQLNSKPSSDGI